MVGPFATNSQLCDVRKYVAEVAELADAQDLKSCEPQIRTGSSPVFGIKLE